MKTGIEQESPHTEPISEREFIRLVKSMINQRAMELNHLEGLLEQVDDLKIDHRLEFFLIEGVPGFKPYKKPPIGYRTGK